MKTKTVTKNRQREREFDVALLECEDEFGSILDDSFLDEDALIDDDDEE
jgi:hypothetical protein